MWFERIADYASRSNKLSRGSTTRMFMKLLHKTKPERRERLALRIGSSHELVGEIRKGSDTGDS